ncbi:MAG: hypothetical protein ACI8PT_000470, partial [Gammaproteobacteria bacterium]
RLDRATFISLMAKARWGAICEEERR